MASFPDLSVNPSLESTKSEQLRFRRVDFGDGYTQISPAGINHIKRTWQVVYQSLTQDDYDELYEFLEENNNGNTVTMRDWSSDNTGQTIVSVRILSYDNSYITSLNKTVRVNVEEAF
jgi:phage-related protein